jgi:CheY-like chemotaxis protein
MNTEADLTRFRIRPLRILCADDNAMLGDMMLCLFSRAGHWVEHVGNGVDAWERISADNSNFDVVLTDHQMPGLTGLQLVELLRQANFQGRIIVHTSALTAAESERYRSFGVAEIVIKSARAEQLLAVVAAA